MLPAMMRRIEALGRLRPADRRRAGDRRAAVAGRGRYPVTAPGRAGGSIILAAGGVTFRVTFREFLECLRKADGTSINGRYGVTSESPADSAESRLAARPCPCPPGRVRNSQPDIRPPRITAHGRAEAGGGFPAPVYGPNVCAPASPSSDQPLARLRVWRLSLLPDRLADEAVGEPRL